MSSLVLRVARDEAVAERGMVAALHPLAAQAGLEMLRWGGNAVDAAVASAFVLGVVEPHGSGLGGGGYLVLHDARSGRDVVIDYAMEAPLAAVPGVYELEEGTGPSLFGWRKVRDDANLLGYRASAIPGAIRGLSLALERYGTMPLREVLAPAIRYAAEGVEIGWRFTLWVASHMGTLRRYASTAAVFLPDGCPPAQPFGSVHPQRFVQSDLARTLGLIAEDGPDVFYRGEIGRAIAAAMRSNGGLISEGDLARYRARVYEGGMTTGYRGYQVLGSPGASGAITAMQSLNLMEQFDLPSTSTGSAEALHLKAEAFRIAFADRYRYLADPPYVPVPSRGMVSSEYARARATEIDPNRAIPEAMPGDPWLFEDGGRPANSAGPGVAGGRGLSTTHLCAVDRDRSVVSLTQTLVRPFGCGVVVPGTGILLNNAMVWFDPEPDRPNSVAPGKRGVNNMAPLILLRDGRPFLAVGAQGGRKIINAVTQIISHVVDHGMSIQEAVASPRIDCSENEMLVDLRFGQAVTSALEARGHCLRAVEESIFGDYFATPVAILIDSDSSRLHGGVSLHGEAAAVGY